MVRPKSPTLIATELMSYPQISTVALLCAVPALVGLYVSILFTMRYWIPDNVVVLILGFAPTLIVLFQLYSYLENPLLPTYEQKTSKFSKDPCDDFNQIIVDSS